MNEPVASDIFHGRRWNGAHTENGLTGLTSRDAWENSNARFVQRLIGSGFIAPIDLPADEIFSRDFGSRPGAVEAAETIDRLVDHPVHIAFMRNVGFNRKRLTSSSGDNNRDLLPSRGRLPWIPRDHLDAGLPGLERTKQGGGRRSDRTQHTAIIRKHAGREDSQQFDGRSALQKATAGCPEHQYISHPHVQYGWEVLARLDLDKLGQSFTEPVPRPPPRLPMATIRRRRPFRPGSMAQPHARPLDRCSRRTRGRWR